jgi:hypothetical protein
MGDEVKSKNPELTDFTILPRVYRRVEEEEGRFVVGLNEGVGVRDWCWRMRKNETGKKKRKRVS